MTLSMVKQEQPVLLVVDDDPAIRMLVQESLEPHGFTVEQADCGEQAMTRYPQLNPDMILLDINMPGMDGITVCRTLRERPDGRFVPILIFTGSDDVDSINQAYQAGASDFITKPINWPILIHHVRYMLRAGQAIIDQHNSIQIQQLLNALTELGSRRFDSMQELLVCILETLTTDDSSLGYNKSGAVYLQKNSGFEKVAENNGHDVVYPAVLETPLDSLSGFEKWHSNFTVLPLQAADRVLGVLLFKCSTSYGTPDLQDKFVQAIADKIAQLIEHIRAELETQLAAEVFANSFDAIAITDATGTIQRVNSAFEEVTGYTSVEVLGKNINLLKSGCQDFRFYRALWNTLAEKGKWQGEIRNRRKNGEIYPEWLSISSVLDGKGQVAHYIAVFIDITDQKNQEKRIQNLAYYDALTGLANRALLTDHMQLAFAQADRSATTVALLFIDLDRFKNINDSLGHAYGDQLLRIVAERFRMIVREGDTIARQGGDEFIVILTDLPGHCENVRGMAMKIAENFLSVIARPVRLPHHDLKITGSIGIALYPHDARNGNDLIKHADTAMYVAKENGRNGYRFFQPHMAEKELHRFALESVLKKAVHNQDFELYYQPQVNVVDDTVIGAECLIRWYSERFGWVSPMEFISLAEDTGDIHEIGDWVLATACRKLKAWEDSGFFEKTNCRYLAVNVSAKQFIQKDFTERVRKIIMDSGLGDLSRLELELTEGCLVHSTHEAIATLVQLRSMGLRISIDDFGTGYSSLSYLKNFPLDTLKIDQSFIRECIEDKSSQAIVKAIIAMADGLGLDIIAEGVETPAQLVFLKQYGCRCCQGYLFAKPLALHEFEQLLLNDKHKIRA